MITRRFNINKIAKYCAPAADADGIDIPTTGGQWDMGPMTFIDDPEALANGLPDPLNRKPETMGDYEEEEEVELLEEEDDDGVVGKEKPEDGKDKGKKPEVEPEPEVEEEEDDELEEEDDELEEEEGDKKPADKAPEDKAVAGLKAEISRLRLRSQQAETARKAADSKVAVLEKQVASEIPSLKAELRELMKQRNAATLDEDSDAMTEADMAAEEVRAKINRIERNAETARERAEAAKEAVDGVIQEAAARACEAYPVLNPSDAAFDERMVDMINAVYGGNLSKGQPMIDAFDNAVSSVMELTGNGAVKSAGKPAAKPVDKAEARARRQQASAATPRTTTGKNRGDKADDGNYRFNPQDFRTTQGKKKLQTSLGIIIPK